MAARAASMIERLVGLLIPPASREEIVGDLREATEGTLPFLVTAFVVIPFVVFSRVRRTSDPVVRLMEAVALYTSFVLAARVLDPSILTNSAGFLRLAIPPAVILAVLVFADAYADPRKRRPLRPMLGPIVGVILAAGLQPAIGAWALARIVFFYGGAAGLILLSTLRMVFPPIADRPQLARIPAHWQKLELEGMQGLLRPLIVAAIVVLIVLSHLLR